MIFKFVISLILLSTFTIHAEDIFYYSCDETKTKSSFVKTSDSCDVGICDMSSYCKTNKGEMYVSHLCPGKASSKCPSMIDCLDNSSITVSKIPKLSPTTNPSSNGNSNGVSK